MEGVGVLRVWRVWRVKKVHNGTSERRWNVKGKSACGRGGEGEEGRGRDVHKFTW